MDTPGGDLPSLTDEERSNPRTKLTINGIEVELWQVAHIYGISNRLFKATQNQGASSSDFRSWRSRQHTQVNDSFTTEPLRLGRATGRRPLLESPTLGSDINPPSRQQRHPPAGKAISGHEEDQHGLLRLVDSLIDEAWSCAPENMEVRIPFMDAVPVSTLYPEPLRLRTPAPPPPPFFERPPYKPLPPLPKTSKGNKGPGRKPATQTSLMPSPVFSSGPAGSPEPDYDDDMSSERTITPSVSRQQLVTAPHVRATSTPKGSHDRHEHTSQKEEYLMGMSAWEQSTTLRTHHVGLAQGAQASAISKQHRQHHLLAAPEITKKESSPAQPGQPFTSSTHKGSVPAVPKRGHLVPTSDEQDVSALWQQVAISMQEQDAKEYAALRARFRTAPASAAATMPTGSREQRPLTTKLTREEPTPAASRANPPTIPSRRAGQIFTGFGEQQPLSTKPMQEEPMPAAFRATPPAIPSRRAARVFTGSGEQPALAPQVPGGAEPVPSRPSPVPKSRTYAWPAPSAADRQLAAGPDHRKAMGLASSQSQPRLAVRPPVREPPTPKMFEPELGTTRLGRPELTTTSTWGEKTGSAPQMRGVPAPEAIEQQRKLASKGRETPKPTLPSSKSRTGTGLTSILRTRGEDSYPPLMKKQTSPTEPRAKFPDSLQQPLPDFLLNPPSFLQHPPDLSDQPHQKHGYGMGMGGRSTSDRSRSLSNPGSARPRPVTPAPGDESPPTSRWSPDSSPESRLRRVKRAFSFARLRSQSSRVFRRHSGDEGGESGDGTEKRTSASSGSCRSGSTTNN